MANTLYVVVYSSALSAPTSTQIAAGQDSTGSAAVYASSQATTVTDTYSFNATGLSAGTSYKASFWHDDADTADVETTGAFVTDSVGVLAVQETGADSAAITGSVFVSAALAAQEAGSDTATISGSVIVFGSLAVQEAGSDTAIFIGTAPTTVTGDLAATETGEDTATIAGTVTITGTLSAQEIGSDSASMTGALLVAGTLIVQESGSDSAALTGALIPSGSGYLSAQESGPDTVAITGTVHVSGVLQAVETGSDTATISGTAPVTVTGTLEVREAGTDSAAIIGVVRIVGTLAAQESAEDSATFSYPVPTDCTDPPVYTLFDKAQRRLNAVVLRQFGEQVTFPSLSLTVTAIYQRAIDQVPGGGSRPGVPRDELRVRQTDICASDVDQGVAVTVRGKAFQVVSVTPGINGMTVIGVRRTH